MEQVHSLQIFKLKIFFFNSKIFIRRVKNLPMNMAIIIPLATTTRSLHPPPHCDKPQGTTMCRPNRRSSDRPTLFLCISDYRSRRLRPSATSPWAQTNSIPTQSQAERGIASFFAKMVPAMIII